ncbi:MAG TPA: efflux RND transporter periplasmic adaptor subunit [Steroidobacteraceae bacterium]|nr:efflux RND transporter periplasmic adaptor subunit [Steroidobacteraceae bacterium]
MSISDGGPGQGGGDGGAHERGALLGQLRIGAHERDAPSGDGGAALWRRWPVRAGALLAVAALALFGWLKWRGPVFEVQVATAVVASPAQGPAAVLQASGYVTARREATVSAQITGTLREVLIEEGEHVKAGQVLARLDDSALQANLAQARAQLAAAQAVAVQLEAQLAQARRDTQRAEGLIDRQLVSKQALEAAQTQQATLAAQLQAQQRQIAVAEAAVRGAQVQLDYCTVRAPFAGVIVAKAAQAGEIISPISAGGGFTRTGVGTIVDMDSLEIEVDVNESYINRVQPQQAAQALLDAYPDWTIPAHVIAIIPTADRNKATVKVRVAFDQKDPRILPDMGVRVSFLEPRRDAAAPPPVPGVLVPASAVVSAGDGGASGGSVVYGLEGDRAHAHAVTPGQVYGDLQSVTGIPAGMRVVRAPPPGLADGARLAVAAADK